MAEPTAAGGGPEGAPRYARVAVDLAAAGADRLFTYSVPDPLRGRLAPGAWVSVPFGRRQILGCYVEPAPAAPPGVEVRPLGEIVTGLPPVPPALLDLARWVAGRYLCPLAAALRLLIPAGARRGEVRPRRRAALALAVGAEAAAEAAARLGSRAPRQAAVLRTLLGAGGPVPLEALERTVGGDARGAAAALVRGGLVRRVDLPVRRDPLGPEGAVETEPASPPALTPAQAAAVAKVEEALAAPPPRQPVLLHGVTGSGKTEVYLEAIARVVAAGRQAIVLVPEIALTPQTVARFRARFTGRVAVLHSALSPGERFDEWLRIRRGEVDIAVGARSAVFAPFERLGLIVVDEEHEATYKQDEVPRYHAREVAEERARREGALVLLGSATPALETFWRAREGRVALVRLPERVRGRPLPPVEIVDMRAELRSGRAGLFSRRLEEALGDALARGEQAILFLNRRGFHTFALCRACGEAVTCPRCSVALTLHRPARTGAYMACHYCGHRQPPPSACPRCGSPSIRLLGSGTERVEAELARLFPRARVVRLDVDTTRRRGSHARILGALAQGRADVLVGTQMVTKGLDLPGVTLVGVVLADTTLRLPDFRAAERTFQLIAQVAGRAGRGDRPGRVVVQTYQPDHFAVRTAAAHDYDSFFEQEAAWRRLMGYPPFAEFVRLVFAGPAEAEVAASADAATRLLEAEAAAAPAEILGPVPAPLALLRGLYRYHVVLKGPDRDGLVRAVRAALGGPPSRWRRGREVRLTVDVGPYSML
ncbi:replication restart helicase PriA [Caldinitratiruptor microaerophilus]|uniref:Replication restart protein PriA n=1 Tax=Caldinitratiruptor microaerophilus TaxID=671077 RepID=A0AA35CJW3_9FIRM|nr:primosomal protein N' [Caldinitratiruptor microaerophilus]BDG60659.1 hypothetical protein caldi_17490 [Caldinitratiruptor microaerophilus]